MKTVSKFQVEGTLLDVGQVQTFSSGFRKRQLIIETSSHPEQWSRPVAVTLSKDKVTLADSLRPGMYIRTDGFIEGRAWTAKDGTARYFTDLSVKAIITETDGAQAQTAAPAPTATPEPDDLDMPY